MSEIHVKDGESIDSALKRFKRSCAKAGVIAEVRKREHYESPSVKRRKKSEAARKNKNKRYYCFSARQTPARNGRGNFYIWHLGFFRIYCYNESTRRQEVWNDEY